MFNEEKTEKSHFILIKVSLTEIIFHILDKFDFLILVQSPVGLLITIWVIVMNLFKQTKVLL
jgi:hypothetical protein